MKVKIILIIFLTLLVNKLAVSQSNDCLKDFDYLVKKIQSDYPGYNDKVTEANRLQLLLLEKDVRQKITRYPDSCGYYLNEYTDFFRDHHLRINRIWKEKNQQSEFMNISTYGKNLYVNVDSLQQKTKNSTGIEGVWEGFREKFVVTRDRETYVGVIVNSHGWKGGQIKYTFEPVNDSVFDVINYSLIKDGRTFETKTSLHLNGKVLEFHGDTRFVRKSNSDILDKSILYSYVPVFPNGINTYPVSICLGDSTYYLRIPSFYDNTGNEFVTQHWNEIMTRPNLIIDIRNNGGGQDNYYQELKRIIYTNPYESKGVEWYASKGNIKYFEDAMKKGEIRDGEEGMKWTQALVEAMKKNVGGFVTHPYSADDDTIVEMDTVYSMPRNIGIIINEVNASAAEQFLLAAQQSEKVILFGNCSTAGVLDYSNITPNPLPSNNYQLWCPMTRSKRLPDNPIDNIGIAPDVFIPFHATEQLYDKLDNWVYFVKNYLELLNEVEKQ
ncbi:MAG: S41 family peptidase [Bacteroidales bacterium]